MDWSKLPDLIAVALLTVAFTSVARYWRNTISGVWLTGWLMIVLHFLAFMFLPAPGHWSDLANFVGMAALACAGVLFMWASVPFRRHTSSRWMVAVLMGTSTLYLGLLVFAPVASWALAPAAVLIGASPLAIALLTMSRVRHPLRWATGHPLRSPLDLSPDRSKPPRRRPVTRAQCRVLYHLLRMLHQFLVLPTGAPRRGHSSPLRDSLPGHASLLLGRITAPFSPTSISRAGYGICPSMSWPWA